MVRRTTPIALIAWLSMGALAGCRTPPWELDGDGPLGDLAIADLTRPPDLVPPRDLVLPFICRDIWVVDVDGTFAGFDVHTNTFHNVGPGPLKCPHRANATPQTMSVARDDTAWVFYDDG